MAELSFFFRGLILGFSIAAPVGPIGILVIRRTLTDGRLVGFVSGLGAATADLFYGGLSGLGLTLIASLITGQAFWIRLVGSGFLIYLGAATFFARPADKVANTRPRSGYLAGAYFSTLLLTLSNPVTILYFAAVFAGMGLGVRGSAWFQAGALIGGVFTGSAAWWLLLSTGVSTLRQKITPAVLVWVNRAAGLVLVVFGLIALASIIRIRP